MKVNQKGNLQVILLGIIIIVALLYMVFIKPFYYQFNGGKIYFEPLYVENFSENVDYDMYVYNGEIYLSSSNGFKKIASDGEHLWDQSYYMPNARLVTADRYMCVADMKGKEAYLFTEEGLVAEVSTSYDILMANVNEVGAMSFLMETEDSYKIEIYNRLGSLAAERDIVVKESGYPVCFDLSPDGKVLTVNQIVVDGESLHSNIQFFAFGDEVRKEPNHDIGSVMYRDTWIGDVAFIDETHLFAVSDKDLLFYDVSDVPTVLSTTPFAYDIEDYGITDAGVVVAYKDRSNGQVMVTVFDQVGRVLNTIPQEVPLKALDNDSENHYLITDNQIEKYEGEKRVWYSDNTRGAISIARLYREYYVIGYDHSYEIVKMKDL